MTVGLTIRMILQEKVKCGKCDMDAKKWFAEGHHKRESEHHCFFHMVAALGFEQVRLPRMIKMLREIRSPANFKKVFENEQKRASVLINHKYCW